MSKIELCGKLECTGCRVCGDVCPKQCISFINDEEGFFTPSINTQECIECGKCIYTCPILTPPNNDNTPTPDTYHAYSLDKNISKTSSSGGIFSELAIQVLDNGGAVCGAMQEPNSLIVKHIIIRSKSDIKLLQGSKYVQSDTSHIYSETLSLLKAGTLVLFSGTPCQVAAMKNIVGGRFRKNLILVEVICHGVPSFLFFKQYLNKALKHSIYMFMFRENSIWDYQTSIKRTHDGKKRIIFGYKDFFMKSFLYGETFQNKCYSCPFASLPRQADITLGDFWGIEDFANHKKRSKFGNSVVLINNSIGENIFQTILPKIYSEKQLLINAKKRNRNIYEPSKRPSCRDSIYQDLQYLTLKQLAEKYNHTYSIRNYIGAIKRYMLMIIRDLT